MSLAVHRTELVLRPDPSRVLLRSFSHGNAQRVAGIVSRILQLPEAAVAPLLKKLKSKFSQRHRNIRDRLLERCGQLGGAVPDSSEVTDARRQLIGAYFLSEYSLEASALFNPSIVPHPDQAGLAPGALRIVLSLRATGEGHISSITFRSGVIHPDHRIEIDAASGFLVEPRQIPDAVYEKALFHRKVAELGLKGDLSSRVMQPLGEAFTLDELRASLKNLQATSPEDTPSQDQIVAQALQVLAKSNYELHYEPDLTPTLEDMPPQDQTVARAIWMLAKSNYEMQFEPDQPLCNRVLFPSTPSQRNGIEDARFVRFDQDDGSFTYYATFTAYDGTVVMPQIVRSDDFLHFTFNTLNGPAAINKGMALFPRKIGGMYAMLGRQDNECIYLMRSDNVHFWNESHELLKPSFPWELVQIGNCGSPIETDAGWLVISHGVGPMREYCIGAFLLDLDDPSKVIGRLRQPLLAPNSRERVGYVPNVVYTCGALIHGDTLILPYGLADQSTGFATVPLADLLVALLAEGGSSE